jgi:hypothetical protein
MGRRATTSWGLCLLCFFGCAPQSSGVAEPFRVRDAQFIEGPLPGKPPRPSQDAGTPGDAPAGPPHVTAIETFNLDVFQGQGAKAFRGRASANASAVLLAIEGAGSGYWVVPTSAPDPVTEELTWSAVTDFELSLKPGKHTLRVVAVDEQSRAGEQFELTLCVLSRVPDNHYVCNPDKRPPHAVISLQWDVTADLDLQVVDSQGHVIDAKHPGVPAGSSDSAGPAGADAMIDRDSNAACANDGLRTENLIWNTIDPAGRYGIYVNLFDACKQPAVRFKVLVYTALDGEDDSHFLKPRLQRTGELLDVAANPAANRGLFVADLVFN